MTTHRGFLLLLALCLLAPATLAQQPPDPPIQDGPMMGINMVAPDAPNAPPNLPPGVTVVQAMEGTPAQKAGLMPGDIILKFDGKDVTGIKSIQALMPTYSIGDTIEITYKRGEETLTTKLTLGSRKAIMEEAQRRDALVGLPMPPFQVDEWINGPVDAATLKGKVVVIHFFEMLCAGSLGYSLPRISKWAEQYGKFTDFALIGIHSTWEMHESQTPDKIKDFVTRREYKYPIGIDHLTEKVRPDTLFGFRIGNPEGRLGTPGTVIVDKKGIVRFKQYGNFDDKEVEKLIETLLAEPAAPEPPK